MKQILWLIAALLIAPAAAEYIEIDHCNISFDMPGEIVVNETYEVKGGIGEHSVNKTNGESYVLLVVTTEPAYYLDPDFFLFAMNAAGAMLDKPLYAQETTLKEYPAVYTTVEAEGVIGHMLEARINRCAYVMLTAMSQEKLKELAESFEVVSLPGDVHV